MQEIWKSLKDIIECGDNYEISNFGKVRSIDFIDKRGYSRKGRIMRFSNHKKGYKILSLTFDGNRKTYKVHRLVALAFIPNPENKPEVNHKDGNKSNNNLDNLEWSTTSENTKHAHENGLTTTKKLSDEDKKHIKENKDGLTYAELSNRFKVSITTIYYVKHGRKSRSDK